MRNYLCMFFFVGYMPYSQSLTLNDAISIAFENAFAMQTSTLQISKKNSMLEVAKSKKGLRADLTFDAFKASQADFFLARSVKEGNLTFPGVNLNDPGQSTHSQIGMEFSLPIFNQEYRWDEASAKSALDAQKLAHKVQQISIEGELCDLYLAILKQKAQIESMKTSIRRVQNQEQQSLIKLAGGSALKTDILDVRVRLREIEQKLLEQNTKEEELWFDFLLLINQDFANRYDLVLPKQSLKSVEFDQLIKTALEERSEIERLKHQIEAVQNQQRSLAANRKLKVDLKASISKNSSDWNALDGNDSWLAGVVVSRQILDSGAQKAQDSALKEQAKILQIHLRRLQLEIESQVKKALHRLSTAKQNLSLSRLGLDSALENLNLKEKQLEGGSIQTQDYLLVEENYSKAKVAHETAKIQLIEAQVRLSHALGQSIKEWTHE